MNFHTTSRSWSDVGICPPSGATGDIRLPCPQCSAARGRERDACLSVHPDRGIWYCHYCGWKGSLGNRSQSSSPLHISRPPAQPDERKRAALARVRAAAVPLTEGDPVVRYLSHRKITLPLHDLPLTIRYHPALPYRHEDNRFTYHPSMVARVDDPNGELATFHRTYLTLEGKKADVPAVKRLMPCAVPRATAGGAIRLYPASETVAVTEGIETALAVRCQTGLAVWATYSAGGMKTLIVPPEVRLVVICADNDPPGLDAAKTLARRMLQKQRRVKLLIPDMPGADWADTLGVRHA